uniref:Uncharacterized protein n=1 Tax=Arundo donax TaxID=35708 RepID=A0A0A9DH48_ARUDO
MRWQERYVNTPVVKSQVFCREISLSPTQDAVITNKFVLYLPHCKSSMVLWGCVLGVDCILNSVQQFYAWTMRFLPQGKVLL